MIKGILKKILHSDPNKVVGMRMDYTPEFGVRSVHAQLGSGQSARFEPGSGFRMPTSASKADASEVRRQMFRHMNDLCQSDIPASAHENIKKTLFEMQTSGIDRRPEAPYSRKDTTGWDSSIDF